MTTRRTSRQHKPAEKKTAEKKTDEQNERESEWLRIDAQTKAAEEARLQRPPEEDEDEPEDE